jgi:hypothetical protein
LQDHLHRRALIQIELVRAEEQDESGYTASG